MIIHTKYTGWRQNDFNVHAYAGARIASVAVAASGGFKVSLKGAATERITMGAVDVKGGQAPVYATAVIGADGTATLTVG